MKKIDTFYLSDKQIEQLKRKKKFNKKLAVSAVLFLISLACYLTVNSIPSFLTDAGFLSLPAEELSIIINGIGGLSGISAAMTFAKSLHDPLTEEEAKELAEKDAIEKGGYKR